MNEIKKLINKNKNLLRKIQQDIILIDSKNGKRIVNKDRLDNNPLSNLYWLTVSTHLPNILSNGAEKIAEHFKYNYMIMGTIPKDPQPNQFSILLFWRWRFDQYYKGICEIIKRKGKDAIIMITDGDDVIINDYPNIILDKFNKMNYNIIISGGIYCCNLDRLKHYTYKNDIDYNIALNELKSGSTHWCNILDNMWNGDDGLLHYDNAQEIVDKLKYIDDRNKDKTPYRYVNAGTYIGKASSLKKMFEDIFKMKDRLDLPLYTESLDDEANINLWYANKENRNNPITRATLDYKQEIFSVVDEFEHRQNERKYLTDTITTNISNLILKNGTFKNQYNKYPSVFHFSGYKYNYLEGYRWYIINNSRNLKWMLSSYDPIVEDYIKEVSKCGNLKSTHNNKYICEQLGCIYNELNNVDEKCKLIGNKPTRTFHKFKEKKLKCKLNKSSKSSI